MMTVRSLDVASRAVRTVVSLFGTLVLAAVLTYSTTSTALASGDAEGGPSENIARPSRNASAPGDNPEAARKAYMTLLFQEINLRRDRAASPRYEYMADAGSEAVDAYLHDLLPAMVETRSCFHGSEQPGMRAGWDYLEDVGIDETKVGGEVLACPDVGAGGFWTPTGIADGWWRSPSHWRTLYGDRRPRFVACGAQEPIRGGLAFTTVACLTLLEDK